MAKMLRDKIKGIIRESEYFKLKIYQLPEISSVKEL